MRARFTSICIVSGFLIGAALISPNRLRAQAGPGPLAPAPQSQGQSSAPAPPPAARPKPPAVPPRTTLAGAWKFNRDDSDDPQQKVRAAENSRGGSNGGGYPGGGYPGGGYPGGGYPGGYPGGGYPYPGGGNGPYGGRRPTGPDLSDNQKLQQAIRTSDSLSIDLKNPEVDVTDDQFHKLILYTDNRQLPKSTDTTQEQVLAHWNGSQLVSDEKSPLGGKMSRTFELSGDGRRLYETLRIDDGRSKSPLVIRYAYDATNADVQSGPDADPDRPVLKRHSDDSGASPQ